MTKRAITLVYNPKSGSSIPLSEMKKKCHSHNLTITHTYSITAKNFETKLKNAIEKKAIIAVIGGDGTISSVARQIAGSKAVMAPLPGGTLNHFTKDLGIPQNIDGALSNISRATKERIDIASVNDLYFVNNSSLGLYPQSLIIRDSLKSYVSKWPAAAYAMVAAFMKFKLYSVTINNKDSFKTPFVFIGNNRYHISNSGFVGRKKFDEGVLCLYAVKTTKRLTFAKLFFAATTGRLQDTDEFHALTTFSAHINASHKTDILISHDGEVSRQNNPLHYKINKKALYILR